MQTTMTQGTPFWRRLANAVPPARWPLLLGALLALPLAFVPWVTFSVECAHVLCTFSNSAWNWNIIPLRLFSDLYTASHPPLGRWMSLARLLLILFNAVGLIGAIWVHGRIKTFGQYLGAGILTLWCVTFVIGSLFAIHWLLYTSYIADPIVGWSLNGWGYSFVLMIALFGVGLTLLWRDIWRDWQKRTTHA